MSRINLKSVARVIDVLGGGTQFRKRYRLDSRQRVSNWRRFGQIPASFHKAMTSDLADLGYEAPASLWGQYEHRKRPKKKPKPVTTSRQATRNGGANGRSGKRDKIRKRPGAVVGRTDQDTQGTMVHMDGGRTVQADGADT